MSKGAKISGRMLSLLWRVGFTTVIGYAMHQYEAAGETLAAMVLAFVGSAHLLMSAYLGFRLSGGNGIRANFIESVLGAASAMMAFHWIDKAAHATEASGFPFPTTIVLFCTMLLAAVWTRKATVLAPGIGRYYLHNLFSNRVNP